MISLRFWPPPYPRVGPGRHFFPAGLKIYYCRFLGDLKLFRTPAVVATRFSSRTAGNGAATGRTPSGNVFPEVGQEEKLEIVLYDTAR